MTEKIYSWKAARSGASATGRVKAPNHQDATRQVCKYLSTFGPGYRVEVNELKNQKAALRKWDEDHRPRGAKESER